MMLSNLLQAVTITFSSPGSIVFHIGDFNLRWYGVFIAFSFLVGYLVAEHLVKKNDYDLNVYSDLVFFVLILSIVFARLWFVALSWSYFQYNLSEIPMIWLGGQSIHGAILGGAIAAFLYSKFKKISFYKYVDIIAVALPLSQAIGRWGNFFNNEAFGMPVRNSIFRLYVPEIFRPAQYLKEEYFHPTFLYESFFDLIIFIFLFRMFDKWKKKEGLIFWTYLLLYSIVRFFIEFLRVDSLFVFEFIPAAQFISVIIILISLIFIKKKLAKLEA